MHKQLDATGYDTDKSSLYLKNYEEYFQYLADKDIKLLELGVDRGGSLLLWADYFTNGTIVGLDVKQCQINDSRGSIHVYQGFQEEIALLDRIRKETAPDGFDIIIDDASHIGELTNVAFWHLFDNHLKPGGLYVIEDWGTGYWDAWPDGKQYRPASHQGGFLKKFARRLLSRKKRFSSHHYGMVGVIKELVDELGMDDITNPARSRIVPQKYPKFKKMEITPGQVFIVKATDRDHELMKNTL